jgi:hypothetical protein
VARVYLDHVDGLDDAGSEHPGGAAVDEGLDGLPDASRGRRRLRLLLRVRHLPLLPDPSGSLCDGLARERKRRWRSESERGEERRRAA